MNRDPILLFLFLAALEVELGTPPAEVVSYLEPWLEGYEPTVQA